MTTAFVTGASGFIGGSLTRRIVDDGWTVRALARTQASTDAVTQAGAEPVRGDLSDVDALRLGARGCDVAFHAAAHVKDWDSREEFVRVNVDGTRNVIEACRREGVRRLVFVGTEAALLTGKPLVEVNEDAPLQVESPSPYCATKAMAERAVLEANGDGLETVVVRLRAVWGPGDRTILPAFVEAVRRGRFAWIGGGRHHTSTTHVQNAVEGLVLGATAGRPGGIYFVTDRERSVFREFIEGLLATQGVAAPNRSIPVWMANASAVAAEAVWLTFRLRGAPPLTRTTLWLTSLECTIDISRAEKELGYRPRKSVAEGMAELRPGSP